MKQSREYWIDAVKIFACILVALGHFFQSMVSSGLMPDNRIYTWFVDTIYYFHVPLFFICSGYLYQKGSNVNSFSEWKKSILKKVISLGVPYFVFSIITWGLKAVFSGAVNSQNEESLLTTLFLQPVSPYWYLYTLFLLFCVMPTFMDARGAIVGVSIASGLKLLSVFWGGTGAYALDKICQNLIWFVIGMKLCQWKIGELCKKRVYGAIGIVTGAVFLAASVLISALGWQMEFVSFLMGLLGCASTILIMLNLPEKEYITNWIRVAAQYTMPVFLMHTIFAAGLRSVFFKLGIENACIHIIFGLLISFTGPIIATEVLKWLRLDFVINPGKYVKAKK